MMLCMHMNTSSGAGYRGALEGWAKAGIKNVELSAGPVDDFLKTDTLEGARKVLADNGLTPVHAAVGVNGLLEPNPNHAAAIESLKKRLEMFAFLGVNKVYTTSEPQNSRPMITSWPTTCGSGGQAPRFNMACRVDSYDRRRLSTCDGVEVNALGGHTNSARLFDFYTSVGSQARGHGSDQARGSAWHFQTCRTCRERCSTKTRFIRDGVSPIVPMIREVVAKGYSAHCSGAVSPEFRDGNPTSPGIRRNANDHGGKHRCCSGLARRARASYRASKSPRKGRMASKD